MPLALAWPLVYHNVDQTGVDIILPSYVPGRRGCRGPSDTLLLAHLLK